MTGTQLEKLKVMHSLHPRQQPVDLNHVAPFPSGL